MTHGDERRILDQCAPALTGVKAGSLLKVDSMVCNDAIRLLTSYGNEDVGTKILSPSGSSVLILVYRRSKLAETLADQDVIRFLSERGYRGSMSEKLELLSERMCLGIQHELGIFLGYPLHDVKGFIENGGRNYKYTGYWRVYGDVKAAKRLFAYIRLSRRKCLRMYDAGLSFRTVANVA